MKACFRLREAAGLAAIASVFLVHSPPAAAGPAWIQQCVDLRRDIGKPRSAVRRYCACMNEIVDEDQPAGISELERAYPPAHRACFDKARMGRRS